MSANPKDSMEAQLRQAIVTIRSLKQQVQTLRGSAKPAVAVVGIGCRLPAGANDPDALWKMLMAGQDAITEVPADRWNADAWYDADPDVIGKMNTRWGGFVQDIDRFDPAFFELSAREAAAMDPQQRLLLEVTWEALEHASIAADALSGSATGVFLGINGSDYYQMAMSSPVAIDAHAISGSVASVAAGRLSYLLGLNGPAIAIDTACSSSLTAVHLAVQSLRSGESRVALAGGTYAVLTPNLSVGLSRLHMMAADGRCKTFDAAADGFVQGEGCAMVVLKRLDDALADGDSILAVIRGSAINQDGRSSSLTAPSRSAQVSVIRAALADADMPAERIGYVEAHGTGTALGDPIELHALADALGRNRTRQVVLGALKSNVGHLGPAAGIAGLVKAVLTVKAGVVPPNLHMHRINPSISLDGLPVVFPKSPTPWPQGEGLRAAGVSAFGFSGTNVHVVLEQAPLQSTSDQSTLGAATAVQDWAVFCPSARSEAALNESVTRLIDALDDAIDLAAASRTSMVGRRAFEFSKVAIAQSPHEARVALAAAKTVQAAARPRLAIVFGDPRRGASAAPAIQQLARTLSAAFPRVREVLEQAAAALPALRGLSDGDVGSSTAVACLALQWAMLEQLRDWGLSPAVCAGEGLGELAAAAASGMLAWPDVLTAIDRCCQPGAGVEQALDGLRPLATAPGAILLDARSGQAIDRISSAFLAGLAQAPEQNGISRSALSALGCTALLKLQASEAASTDDASLLELTLLASDDPVAELMLILGTLHAHGLKLDWRKLLGNGPRAQLPLYPFQRGRYWRAAAVQSGTSGDGLPETRWPPGRRVLSPSRDAQFRLALGVERLPWLGDHRVHGLSVVPGAFQIACMAGAWRALHGDVNCEIADLTFARPLIAPETGALELWTLLTPEGEAQLAAHVGGNWVVHAQARIVAAAGREPQVLSLDDLRKRCAQAVSPHAWRERLVVLGITIGPSFQGIRRLWEAADEALAEVVLPAGCSAPEDGFHAALLDACLQVAGGAMSEQTRSGEALLPVGIDRLRFFGTLQGTLWVHARCTAKGEVLSTELSVSDPTGKVLATVEGLHVRRAPMDLIQSDPCLELFHAIEWKPSPLETQAASSGTRLIVARDAAAGQDLMSRLAEKFVLVTLCDSTSQVEPAHWRVAPRQLDRLIAQLADVSDVVDLQAWSQLDPQVGDDPSRRALETIQSLLRLAHPPRLWLVTQSAMLDARNPAQASVWGLGATLALEHPALDCRRIDADSLASVAAELHAEAGPESMSLWRDGTRRVPRLVQRRPRRAGKPTIELRDTVLITGGLGGLGREVARWAVAHGARQLILSSRHASGADAEAFARSLGVPVKLIAADLSQAHEVEHLMTSIEGLPPLRAVFHAAGSQAEGLLEQMPWPQFESALAAKLRGAWWLHRSTRALPLDHFVMFSSIASLLGAAGQGGYAAANAGLDALARHRRANGLPGLSIAWGRWDGAGMADAIDEAARRRIDAIGVAPMPPALALAALEVALAGELIDPMIAAIDWDRYRSQHPAAHTPRLLAELGTQATSNKTSAANARPDFRSLAPAERTAALLERLTEQLRSVLGLQQGQRLDAARPLVQLGMDSLMAMEIRNRMQRDFGQACSIADLLGGASLREIASKLAGSVGDPLAAPEEAAASPAVEQWEEFKL
ncbi:hypothetical protein BH11PSE11_BH11PSE11_05010 [soil metagenome]